MDNKTISLVAVSAIALIGVTTAVAQTKQTKKYKSIAKTYQTALFTATSLFMKAVDAIDDPEKAAAVYEATQEEVNFATILIKNKM